MAALPIISDAEASAEAQVLFEHCTKMLGRTANALRIAAHSPRVAQPLVGFMIAALRQEISGVLDVKTKTLVILKTSMLNGCTYCVGHNTALGLSLGYSDRQPVHSVPAICSPSPAAPARRRRSPDCFAHPPPPGSSLPATPCAAPSSPTGPTVPARSGPLPQL